MNGKKSLHGFPTSVKEYHPATSDSVREVIEKKLHHARSAWDRLPLLIQLARWKNDPDAIQRFAIEAFNLAKELNDKFWIARSLQALSTHQLRISQNTEAIRGLQKASAIFKELNDIPNKAETDLILAQVLTTKGDYGTAMQLLLEVIPIFKEMADPEKLSLAYGGIGDIYRITGDHSKGIRCYRQAISLALSSGLVLHRGKFYQQIALSCRMLEDTEGYRRYMFKSLAANRDVNNVPGIAVALGNIANSYIDQEMFSHAEKYVRLSGKLYRKLGYVLHEAISWGRLGRIYQDKGELEKAFRCHKKGIALARQGEDKMFLGTLYESLGGFFVTTGRPAQGINYLKKGVALLNEGGDKFYRYRAYGILARAYEIVGETGNALQSYKEHARIKQEYIDNQKLMEASRAEISVRFRRLIRQLRREESEHTSLQQRKEEQEAKIVSATLALIQEKEKHRRTINCSIEERKEVSLGNWEIFARQFHKVYDTFYFTMIRDYPALTQMELKVCSLIRIGLSSKEISALLCISVRTVDRHREEIRKRLGLPPRFSLRTFIADL